ncbi:hypothetical protein ZIOFF_024286 [Zingiber officinale]|uniref:EGF-like domain-containing protein n=1 Tax=Zingiber officinale TaxID=94328 RepID=A0A8J5LD28_ZINOF|nr:hypothetical protein ZIOFF_024286 [Zingiber officinale]
MGRCRGSILGLLFLGLWVPPVLGRFVVEKNSLMVTSPPDLRGKQDSAIGNFGIPQYGGSLAGAVVFPKENAGACHEFSRSDLFKSKAGGLPNFILIDRGDCLFAKKVWHAQNAGASAVLVVDDKDEPLITMDLPREDDEAAKYIQNITIPSALIDKNFGEQLKKAVRSGEMVIVNLDWREAVPHPDDRVEYELWTNSNDECGAKCDVLMGFLKEFKGSAQLLEKGGYSQFTPHYITWYCPQAFIASKQCKSQCINNGRYCAPDPEQDFSIGYDGKDVVIENLRQLCVFRVVNESKRSWIWWDYVTDFHIRCPMKEKKYNKECAETVMKSLGIDVRKVEQCMGDPNADRDNPILKMEQDSQVGTGSRGDVTILPTLIVNNRQYRGKLEKKAVLKAICAGFEETTEPAACLNDDIETNECLNDNGGCWEDKASNITACKVKSRTIKHEEIFIHLYQLAIGPGKCRLNNGGCWHGTRDGKTFSACQESVDIKCQCPPGFDGDGVKACESKRASDTKATWAAVWVLLIVLAVVALGAYAIYKYRLRYKCKDKQQQYKKP